MYSNEEEGNLGLLELLGNGILGDNFGQPQGHLALGGTRKPLVTIQIVTPTLVLYCQSLSVRHI